jgi:hypothetical protein
MSKPLVIHFTIPNSPGGNMDATSVIQSQYLAALAMLEQAVQKCPASVWDDAQDKNRFWLFAFHTLFFTHLYLQPTEEEFVRWHKHREEVDNEPFVGEPYTPAEILEYIDFCRDQVAQQLPKLDYTAPSGFSWLPFNKLELQFYNIRHIQHHTGELYERLGTRAGVELRWVGKWPR